MPNHAADPGERRRAKLLTLGCAALAATVFLALGSVRLTAQGLQYDELNQAVGAFDLLGRPSPSFVHARLFGLPVLVQPWSGALKTNLFGVYLRATGAPFSPFAWRLFGLALAAGGLFALLALVGGQLGPAATTVLAALLVTDSTLLLHSRFEVGPVAMSFALRALFLAALCTQAWRGEVSGPRAFALGLLVSLAILEKLSSAALLLPLAVALAAFRELRTPRALGLVGLGFGLGLAPLAAVNVESWRQTGAFISLEGALHRDYPALPLPRYAFELLSLGAGEDATQMFLGEAAPRGASWVEAASLAAALAALLTGLSKRGGGGESDRTWRLVAVLVAAWLGSALFLAALPKGTTTHHWISLTPLQDLALALALSVTRGKPGARAPWRRVLVGALAVLLAARVAGLVVLERALLAGKSSVAWSPSLTVLGESGARIPETSIFVAADWGVATQLFALAQGRQDHVLEPFWDYRGAAALAAALEQRGKTEALVVAPDPPLWKPEVTANIFADTIRWQGWQPVEAPRVFRGLPHLRVQAMRRLERRRD